tara:strand:+ start:315 stop:506 length:192 start_codon:yes stop_codon:yes gene_type:complete
MEYYCRSIRYNSIEDAGVGRGIYICGTGRYLDFIKKECTYALNYLNPKVRLYKKIFKASLIII